MSIEEYNLVTALVQCVLSSFIIVSSSEIIRNLRNVKTWADFHTEIILFLGFLSSFQQTENC